MMRVPPRLQIFIACAFGVVATFIFWLSLLFELLRPPEPIAPLVGIAFYLLLSIATGFFTILIAGIQWFWQKTILACPMISMTIATVTLAGPGSGMEVYGPMLVVNLISWGATLLGAFVARRITRNRVAWQEDDE